MTNQWFYIQQWQKLSYERLKAHRTVRVSWDSEGKDQREVLPQFVTLPAEVELTNQGICNYLSDTFGWTVYDWSVSQRKEDETRV